MPRSRMYTRRHYQAIAQVLIGEREKNGASPVLNRITAAFAELFVQDCQDSGAQLPYRFDPVLFRQAALGTVPVTTRPRRRQSRDVSQSEEAATLRLALRQRRDFTLGQLGGRAVMPHNQTRSYSSWARGSMGRLMAGSSAGGTVLAMPMGGGSPLPTLGLLDPAPAMAMALGEAAYIVRSLGTPIAWFLGPEVPGQDGAGEWIQTIVTVDDDWSGAARSDQVKTGQARVQAALAAS